jgi:hypothetical protein
LEWTTKRTEAEVANYASQAHQNPVAVQQEQAAAAGLLDADVVSCQQHDGQKKGSTAS